MRNFRNLKIWTNGIELVKEVCRAAISVPSNIAEGCSRSSEKEYERFLEIAMGSLFERANLLTMIQKLEIIQEEQVTHFLRK